MVAMSSIWTVRRSATDAKLTGLCAGLGRHWGVDPVIIRVGAVLLALSGGIGLVLYLAGWLLIPVDGKTEAPIHDVLGEQANRWPREAWIVIVAICCILAFAVLGSITPFGFGPAVVLALIWYFGYYKNRSSQPAGTRRAGSRGEITPSTPVQVAATQPQFFSYTGPPTPFTEAAMAWRRRVEEAQRSTQQPAGYRAAPAPDPYEGEDLREPVGPAESLPPVRAFDADALERTAFLATPDPVGLYVEPGSTTATVVQPPRRGATRSAKRLRLVSLVAVGLTLSGLGLASYLGAAISPSVYLAATLLVLGLTLVAATWFGRARGILPVALLVLLATVASSTVGPVAESQGWSTDRVTYTTAAQLAPGDTQELGQLVVDLSGLTTTKDVSYTAHVGLGNLEVTAPRTVNVVVNWRFTSGALMVDGEQLEAGSDLSGQQRLSPALDPRKKTLTLNLSVDQGVVQVRR
jgi:phage shock protein PspC (stress-responsive transcriptional regulator)